MSFYLKSITVKTCTGMLYSKVNIGEVLRNRLPLREYRNNRYLVKDAVDGNFVVYNKKLLDEPELDDKIAKGSAACIYQFKGIEVCYPQTILFIRKHKNTPVLFAKLSGMEEIAKKLLSKNLPVDLRFKGYEVFNHIIDLDKRNGTNAYLKTLQLSALFIPDIERYGPFIDRLWLDPTYNDYEYHDIYLLILLASGIGNYTHLGSKGYYSDDRIIEIINDLLNTNNLGKVDKVNTPIIEKYNI